MAKKKGAMAVAAGAAIVASVALMCIACSITSSSSFMSPVSAFGQMTLRTKEGNLTNYGFVYQFLTRKTVAHTPGKATVLCGQASCGGWLRKLLAIMSFGSTSSACTSLFWAFGLLALTPSAYY